MRRIMAVWVGIGVLGVALQGWAAELKAAYPEGYRQWTHVKSMAIQPGHALENPFQGLHHIYANPQAMKGYDTGNFPESCRLVLGGDL